MKERNFKGLKIVTSNVTQGIAVNWTKGEYVLVDSPVLEDTKDTSKFLQSRNVWSPSDHITIVEDSQLCVRQMPHLTQINPRDYYF